MNIEINDTTVYSFEIMNAEIKAYKDNFETNKMNQLTELSLNADISATDKLAKMNEIAKQLVDNIQPTLLAYFNGKLYLVPIKAKSNGAITSRVKGGGKFQIGSSVQMVSGEHRSAVYTVAENNKVLDADKVPFSPSVLTKQFHCEILGNADNGWDMAGLSHKYWVSVE